MLLIKTFLNMAIFLRWRYIADLHNSPAFLWREKTSLKSSTHTLLDGEFVIKHTLLDGEFVIKHTLLDGEFVIKHTLLDGEFVIKHTLLDGEFVINTCLWWRSSS